MTTLIAVCAVIITLELALGLAFFIAGLLRIQQAARAIEVLAYRLDEEVDHAGSLMRSGWMKALQSAASVAFGIWSGRRRDRE